MAIHFRDPLATFIHIPKTGGSSFNKWIKLNMPDNAEHSQINHISVIQAKQLYKDLGFTFAFVRNPFARLVSMYHFIGQRAIERIEKRKQGRKVKQNTTNNEDLIIASEYNKGFDYWIESWYYNTDDFMNTPNGEWNRRNPQSWWLDAPIDLVIKLEEIDQQFNKIQKLFKCNAGLLHMNKSTHQPYQNYYTPTTREYVEDLHREDFEKFDYDFS